MNNLELIFKEYSDFAQSRLKKITTRDLSRGILKLIGNKKKEFLIQIDELEEGVLFLNLVNETRNVFSGNYHKNGELGWLNAIKTFFRRSGLYCDIYYNEHVGVELFYEYYCSAFQKTENIKYYFAPIELVSFAKSCMDFGEFQIRKLSMVEFEKVFPSRIYEIFYPWALVNLKLINYWYILSQERVPAIMLGETSSEVFEITDHEWEELDEITSQVHMEFTEYPDSLLPFIQRIALFDWQMDYDRKNTKNIISARRSWKGFRIPFIIEYCDNLLDLPGEAPDPSIIENIETEPYIDDKGKDVGEGPSFYFNLDKDETDAFYEFIKHVSNILEQLKLKQNGWLFLETSLNFFTKGFFTKGIEQMLWHITSLEALLGEKGIDLTKKLSQRIASILKSNGKEREVIIKRFKKLYNFRCELVHGKAFSKKIYIGHLADARDLSRQTIIWFINYLSMIKEQLTKITGQEKMPKREDILKIMDLDESIRTNLDLLKSLPDGFPYVKEWIK